MEFDKSRVYTALNADEVKPGSKVIVADNLATLRQKVEVNNCPDTLEMVHDECATYRFRVGGDFMLCYLVSEPKKRRMTYRELAEWLIKGNGQMRDTGDNTICPCLYYSVEEDKEEVPERYIIRKWGSDEWHEPVIEEADE